ncbi:hypothetical protein V1286_007679 [Bradyrhizobium algeriense]|uniref:Uncharacterized protein n=1 Tax=Bradyrhizobium algeriense TaxID=634784 RepID=A0ABU8BNU2_9BRAD
MLLPVSDILPMIGGIIGIMISSIIIFSRRRRRGRGWLLLPMMRGGGPRQTAPGSLESSLYIKLPSAGLIFYTYHSLQLDSLPLGVVYMEDLPPEG